MSFVQPAFPLFLGAVVAVYWLLRARRLQNLWLLAASAIFYGWRTPWWVLLLAFSVLLDYSCALRMQGSARRGAWLALSLAGNLGLLGAFKYLDFALSNLALLGVGAGPVGVALPAGVSFFTFQTMSYTIDVYRGRLAPRRGLLDYATFVCLFPQLVAGPIERARDLLPQVEAERRFDADRLASGLSLALWGAVQKVVVADTLALYVDRVFAMEAPSGALVWAACAGFSVQILADFSGYTDIARGCARMLGFELRVNFRAPYAARDLGDFWRRWHISFSSWIHEYLYRPLAGGSRAGWRRHGATVIALTLAGLWHGAAWTFVAWGAYFAALMLAWRALRAISPRRLPAALAIPATYLAVLGGMLLFRAPTIQRAWALALAPWGADARGWALASVALSVTCAGGALLAVGGAIERSLPARLAGSPWRHAARSGWWALAAVAIAIFWRDAQEAFIYFQF